MKSWRVEELGSWRVEKLKLQNSLTPKLRNSETPKLKNSKTPELPNSTLFSKNIIALNQIDEIKLYFEKIVLMRGIAMLVSGFYEFGERDIEDIDILVEEKEKENLFEVLRKLKYSFVPSGEVCFRRKEFELPIDLHFKKKIEYKEVFFEGKNYRVLKEKELFFDLLTHIYYQHYELREKWKNDFFKLKQKIEIDLKELEKKNLLNAYNFVLKNLDKKTETSDYMGHFVPLIENFSFSKKIKYLLKKFFPDIEFMKRRYALKNNFEILLFYFLRPFLLIKDFTIFLKRIIFLLLFLFFTISLRTYEGRIYLKNGNIFDGDIYFSSRGVVSVKIFNGSLEFEPTRIDRIVFNSKDVVVNKEFLEKVKKIKYFNRKIEKYDDLIEKVAEEKGVDPLLIKAIIKVESNFKKYAISRKGAMGLMQLMPHTAKKLGIDDVYDEEENLRGGVQYLKKMLEKFEGDLILALAAYNAGPLAVERYKSIPPYNETRKYVEMVLRYYREYKKRKTGFYILQDENGNIYFREKIKKGLKNLLLEK